MRLAVLRVNRAIGFCVFRPTLPSFSSQLLTKSAFSLSLFSHQLTLSDLFSSLQNPTLVPSLLQIHHRFHISPQITSGSFYFLIFLKLLILEFLKAFLSILGSGFVVLNCLLNACFSVTFIFAVLILTAKKFDVFFFCFANIVREETR